MLLPGCNNSACNGTSNLGVMGGKLGGQNEVSGSERERERGTKERVGEEKLRG